MITLDKDIEDAILKASEQFRLDANLVRAIIMHESEGACQTSL